ncbi:BolA family protein [Hydrocarboniclastica marina]|uniref:BolA family transcriptional regulator n=1 Tax=Hydrocarboniclastica marina TaxID=2259620 RepID=A0A4P7XJL9_9ALTE|nr:BolA/IbaG family iron-sulfur metabolism protein [Hydrocarboniclastica marina]MAL97998.1 cell division protein BolA [Alteromonadaceae bacterium]QCF26562.1 BolA family transcriptional regulator [Hydrocarboniclastica marina]|tara:strand:+ start:1555 stop:1791 length:237 start_codon:yes stop_codon:yes gene_type:complete
MQAQEVEAMVKAGLPDCEIQVQADGNHYLVVAVGDRFAGMSAVKKQQLIYGTVKEPLADGRIHALTIKAFTPDEWKSR